MSDLIDRGALVDKTEILYQHTESGKIIPWSAVRVCAINNTPTVDAEPVRHGRWEWKDGAAYCTAHKGKTNPLLYGYGYCPLCGARMDGGDNK